MSAEPGGRGASGAGVSAERIDTEGLLQCGWLALHTLDSYCQRDRARRSAKAAAAVPERIVSKSVLSDQVIIKTVVAKYCASLPLCRQRAVLGCDADVEIALSTLNDIVLRVGKLMIPIAAMMKRELLDTGERADARQARPQSSVLHVAVRLARQRRSVRLPHAAAT
jgi:hypothetical protein